MIWQIFFFFFSGIPIKVHPSVLLNSNISWLMINLFPDIQHIEPYYRILQETWFLIPGSYSWYYFFPILQYTFSTLWLLLHLYSETASLHPIGIIDSRRRGPHHSKCNFVNHLYYMCEIESFQSLLFQYSQRYKQYSASQICHCQNMISFLILFFYHHPMNAQQILFQEFFKLPCKLQNQELWWMVMTNYSR